MANTTGKVKYFNAKFLLGIHDNNSGTLQMLKFSRNGVIQLADDKPALKRPNQYRDKMK